ncbi:MAG: flavodoxin-dependent (E)-4-hydroxy-3-methylbut-2-enyl-diphosphate synthase [Synergistetes bacterium]|nr:flavodoxin-dependent (E)-4-hydroxy-3-methylbut-2-enyl-diphosphate synthase [Synergistota bacterium]MCX8127942.1 flavodoxin-dependent (E)-4-hydroxy-3-methylbut-2-enyl-diphosphate synthase [Synergistota bacterium]MDW8192017.1 flavodoxin-dependent (E)-4-hydroxy-3-methylbut-2-enyl-diphosphate synthase [Synergistota bacterium]
MGSKKTVYLGGLPIGGGNPIVVQSMLRSSLDDLKSCVFESLRLLEGGCEVIRVALVSDDQLPNLLRLKKEIKAPLVADVHYVPALAIKALLSGADGVRINPGNMRDTKYLKELARVAREEGKVIRVGVNLGSLPEDKRKLYEDDALAMVNVALETIAFLEEEGFKDIKVSLKASNVMTTVRAYRLVSKLIDYPLHLGITEAGPVFEGAIKSAVGLGILLAEGIGDTIRVSLTGDGLKEVEVAYEILKALGLRKRGIEIVSCPRCGRCEIDLERIVEEVKSGIKSSKRSLKVAIMGCVVNGPGEAKDADIGIAGGRGKGVIFRKGKIIETVDESHLVDRFLELMKEVEDHEDE